MHHPPFWVRALRFCGFAPQNALLCLADLLALTGTALAVFLLRAAFGGVDPVLYQWVLPLLVVLVAIPGVVILGVLLAMIQRFREIEKGEAEDAKQY